jgi:hypothetical protein
VTEDPVINPLETDHERRIGASTGKHPIEQQAALKAIAIGKSDTAAQPPHVRNQPPLNLVIPHALRAAPCPPRDASQWHEVLEEAEDHVSGKKFPYDESACKAVR